MQRLENLEGHITAFRKLERTLVALSTSAGPTRYDLSDKTLTPDERTTREAAVERIEDRIMNQILPYLDRLITASSLYCGLMQAEKEMVRSIFAQPEVKYPDTFPTRS